MKIATPKPGRRQPTVAIMNEYLAKEGILQAEKFFNSACVMEPARSVIRDSVATSRALYLRAAADALYGAKALTELADTVWSSTKMLNDKIIQNTAANAEAALDAAQALAGATSFTQPRSGASSCSSLPRGPQRRARSSLICSRERQTTSSKPRKQLRATR
jgi:hypothetical protein